MDKLSTNALSRKGTDFMGTDYSKPFKKEKENIIN